MTRKIVWGLIAVVHKGNCVLKPTGRKEPQSTFEKRNQSVLSFGNANLIGASKMQVRKTPRRVLQKNTRTKIIVVTLRFKRKEKMKNRF